jgi:hypothetical protein
MEDCLIASSDLPIANGRVIPLSSEDRQTAAKADEQSDPKVKELFA